MEYSIDMFHKSEFFLKKFHRSALMIYHSCINNIKHIITILFFFFFFFLHEILLHYHFCEVFNHAHKRPFYISHFWNIINIYNQRKILKS